MSSAPEPTGAQRRGLGRGLEVLLGGAAQSELAELPVDAIHPNPRQPRRRFDHEADAGLAESIRSQGVVQPGARPSPGRGRLGADRRRAPLARRTRGRRRRPCRRSCGRPTTGNRSSWPWSRTSRASSSRRSRRRGPTPRSSTSSSCRSGTSQSESAARSRPSRTGCACSSFPDDVLAMVERGELSEGHARAVLAVPDQEGRRRLARQIVRGGLSVRAAERAARWAGAKQKPRARAAAGRSSPGRARPRGAVQADRA